MSFDEIKQLLKNSASVVVMEDDRPAYIVMNYSFFEKIMNDEGKEKVSGKSFKPELNYSLEKLTNNLTLEELEEDLHKEEENSGASISLSDLPV